MNEIMVDSFFSFSISVSSVVPFPRSFSMREGKPPYYRKSSFSNNATEALHAFLFASLLFIPFLTIFLHLFFR